MAGWLWPFQHRWCHTATLRTIEPLTQALIQGHLNSLIFKSIRSVIIMEEGGVRVHLSECRTVSRAL